MANTRLAKIGKASRSVFHGRFFLTSAAVLAADVATKILVEQMMFLGRTVPIIPRVFHLTYIQNTGAGFGILRGRQSLLIFVSVLVSIYILFQLPSIIKERKTIVPFGLIFGGACGNLIDRVMLGYVVDFLDFRVWPVFNIADSAITVGALWLAVYYWREEKR